MGGYDPKSPSAFFKRLEREHRRSAALWDAESTVGTPTVDPSGEWASTLVEAQGPGWSTQTLFTTLLLDPIVLADFAKPLPVRIGKYLRAFADLVLSGTAFRIFRHAWRFGCYFLFPFACLVLYALIGALAGTLAARWTNALIGLALAVLIFFGLARWLGQRWPANHLMDLWSFSRDFMRGRRPDAEAQLDRFAAHITETLRAKPCDEVLLVGHSTGALLMLDLATRCLKRDPDFARRARHVSLLTLGSTALKAGLHPDAKKFRADMQRLAAEPDLEWVEIQCMTDIINFHRSEPGRLMGLMPAANKPFPLVRNIYLKEMMDRDAYKRIRRSFFRVHYQYVSGNTRRYFYDWFLVCCGPVALGSRMRMKQADLARRPEGQATSEHAA